MRLKHKTIIDTYVWPTTQTAIMLISLYYSSTKRSSPRLLSSFAWLQHTLRSWTPFFSKRWMIWYWKIIFPGDSSLLIFWQHVPDKRSISSKDTEIKLFATGYSSLNIRLDKWKLCKMLFLTNEQASTAEIATLSARDMSRPGFRVRVRVRPSWVVVGWNVKKGYPVNVV